MQQSQKAAAKSKAQCLRGLCFKLQRSVIQLQLFQCIPQIVVFTGINGIQPTVHHRVHFPIPMQWLACSMIRMSDGISDTHILDGFDRAANPAYLAAFQHVFLNFLRIANAYLQHLVFRSTCHKPDMITNPQSSFLDANIGNDTAVCIIQRVKHQRLQRCMRVPGRCRYIANDCFQHILYVQAVFRRYERCVAGIQSDNIFNFLAHNIRLCTGKINFIDNRNDFQIIVQSQIYIGQCLCLDALSRIHDQNSSLTGRKRTGYLICKIDMSRCIYQMENIILSILRFIFQLNGIQLDCNATLPFQIHGIQQLFLHFPLFNSICNFKNTIGQS